MRVIETASKASARTGERETSEANSEAPRRGLYRWYALAILALIYMLNLVDRGLMMLFLQPIKEELGLSDTQLGLLTGIAFGLFYTVLGVPIARWADRGNRVSIASLAIGLWGLTVMATLFVTGFTTLVCARIAAAVGESGCKPPTYSLVGDYFPERRERSWAMSIFLAGGPFSAIISFVLGGWLLELYGWRVTFFIMGVPGIALAVLARLTLRDPRREDPTSIRPPLPPLSAVFGVLWRQRTCRHVNLALILLYTIGLGMNPWYVAFLMRNHGMTSSELGIALGLIFSIGGVIGVLIGGALASRFFAYAERAQLLMSAITVGALMPCFAIFLTVGGKWAALAALVPVVLSFSIFLGPTYALLQQLVPDDMRATMMAVVLLLSNLIGMGIGPLVVGVLSDMLQPVFGIDSLRYAMLTVSLLALWSAVHFWLASRTVAEDIRPESGHAASSASGR